VIENPFGMRTHEKEALVEDVAVSRAKGALYYSGT
jgi:hypothetical protein